MTARKIDRLQLVCVIFITLSSSILAASDKCTTGFSVVAPESAVPGKTTAVLISLHREQHDGGRERPVNVSLMMETQGGDDNDSTIIAVTSKMIYGHGIIPLHVPMVAPGPHTLHARVSCPAPPSPCALVPSSSSSDSSGHKGLGESSDHGSSGSSIDKPPSEVDSKTGCAGVGGEGEVDCRKVVLRSHSLMRLVGPVRDVVIRTDRMTYSPEDTVTVWIMALDHDLHLPKNILGTVYLKDSAGTKVAMWDQVPMDEGVKKFTIGLSPRAISGTWSFHVTCGGGEWSGALNVSEFGSRNGASRSSGGSFGGTNGRSFNGAGAGTHNGRPSAVEEHYVELRFSEGTRRRYKPGLPFTGKVEAVSTERYIRVRVKVYDNTTSIYSQDIEISQGEGSFTVPAVLADSDVIHLQAELVSVEGKEIESHYILAREPILKWNSSSECYILIEGMDKPMQVGGHAVTTVVSTCPCDRPALLAVVTGGRATHWAERRAPKPAPPQPGAVISWGGAPPRGVGLDGSAICRFNFSFPVKADMAPSSQVLVYYVTPDGEPVSDVTEFQVQLIHKQVSVAVEVHPPGVERGEHGHPGSSEHVQVHVSASPGSLVCLMGGSGTMDKFEPWNSVHRHQDSGGDPSQDFLTAGLTLFQRRCGGGAPPAPPAASTFTYRRGTPQPPRARPLLPQHTDTIWMWDCFNYTLEKAHRRVPLLPDLGRSLVWAASVGPEGLRSGPPLPLPAPETPPLAAPLVSPPPLVTGEQIEMDVSIANPLDACMDVTALLSLSGGAQFVSNGMLYVTERLRLGPRGATALVVRIVVTKPGIHNLTADVSGYVAAGCEAGSGSDSEKTGPATGPAATRAVRSAQLIVKAEGLRKTDTESAYFCANEHTLISTKDKYAYEWISAPRNRAGLVFEVRAKRAIRVALSDQRKSTDSMYHVNIGDGDNSLTWIGRGQHGSSVHLISTDTPGALSEGEFRTYWVSWERGALTLGRGASPAATAPLATWRLDSAHKVRHVGFSAPWGEQAEFRVWNFNDEAGFSQVVQLSLPRWAVPGSAAGELLVSGGLALPAPFRSGIRAAPDETPITRTASETPTSLAAATAAFAPLLTLDQINSTQHEAFMKMLPGMIQTILSYRRNDNSFSDHPSMSSHLSTVRVLEVLTKAQSFFGVDPELLDAIKRWVQLRQEEDGSFTPLPADIKISLLTFENDLESNGNKKNPVNAYEELDYGIVEKWRNLSKEVMQLERIVEVTAETLATLLEIGIENEIDADTISKAKSFLEKNLHNLTSSHPLASTVYALVLAQSPVVPEALEILRNASTTEEGDFGWPHPLPRREADWLYEEDSSRRVNPPILTSLEDFRASLCALSIHSALGDLRNAEPAARYLFYRSHLLDAHSELLYHAVKAFSAFSALAYDRHRSLTVSLATAGMELTDTVELQAHLPPRHLHLPSLPTKVFVYATGAGCATVQGRITYSTYTPSSDNALLSLWSAVIEEIRPERSSLEELQGKLPTLNMKTCFRWKSKERSGVLRFEVTLFSGYELVSVSPVVIDQGNFTDLQHGSKDNFIWFAFSNISSTCPVCINYQARSTAVLSSLRPAFATIYPSTRPDLAAEVFFHTKPGSPLLKGITEDDLITWFGKSETGTLNVGQDIPNICECGKICRSPQVTTSPPITVTIDNTPNQTEPVKVLSNDVSKEHEETIIKDKDDNSTHQIPDIPIIIPSVEIVTELNNTKLNIDTNNTNNNLIDEIVIQQKLPAIKKPTQIKVTDSLRKQLPKKQLPRKKGTLKHTYGETQESYKKNLKFLHDTNELSTLFPISTETKENSNRDEGKFKNAITTESAVTETTITTKNVVSDNNTSKVIQSTIKSIVSTHSSILNASEPFENTESASTTTENSVTESKLSDAKADITLIETQNINMPDPTKAVNLQMPKSINREKQHPPAVPISETTLGLVSENPPQNFLSNKNDQMFVIDKNALWGLLKEVVRIEMDKNQEKLEAESNTVDKNRRSEVKHI